MLTDPHLPHGHEVMQRLTKDRKILGRTVGRIRADESNPRGSVEDVSRDWRRFGGFESEASNTSKVTNNTS